MSDLERLLHATGDADPAVREQAVGDLGDLGLRDQRVIDRLIVVLLDDPADNVRAFAAGSLGLLRDPFGCEPLLRALDDACWRVRYTALWSLGELRDRRAVPELARLAADPDARVRAMAAEQLGIFAPPDALDALLPMLRDADADVQWCAVNALYGFDSPRCLEPLRELVASYAGREHPNSQGNDPVEHARYLVERIERSQREAGP